jgi:predicted nucleic acid-binding protein
LAVIRAVVDKSALARSSLAPVERVLGPMLIAGELATCAITTLEMLYSARTGKEWTVAAKRLKQLPTVPITDEIAERAIEVQGLLWNRGKVRAAGIPDLLIAAAAEAAGVEVIHYDRDFDVIAKVTGQAARWVVPAGTVD